MTFLGTIARKINEHAVAFLLFTTRSHAQSSSSLKHSDIFSAGPGFGQDYGGFVANATVYPQKNIGIFGGVGHAPAGTGYNVGVKLRQLPKHGACSGRPIG